MIKLKLGAALAAVIITMTSCSSKENRDVNGNASANDAANSAIENIMSRTSVREYAPDRKISPDTVEILLRAAMAAPTAVNKQPWAYVVLDTREALDSLAEVLPYAKMLRHAPLAIVTCGNMQRTFQAQRAYWIQDVSASTENLLLAANALGLGAVWTGVYPTEERVKAVSERLGLPANIIPLAVVPVGYPAKEHQPKDKWNPSVIHYNRW